ncbi:hypothetical protein FRC01_009871 [Tulasnella sp. 417]|nr:hypothetical protein FRC01_009871 [Tulasnella sp. 417]
MSQPFAHAQYGTSSHPSSRLHILGLPLEILLMVITDVIVEEGKISFQERTRVRLICKTLNNFVNVTPSFWNQLSVWEPQEFWQQHLDKADQLKLAVICDCSPDQELYASFLSFIFSHAHRIYSLDCTVNLESSGMVADMTSSAAPILRDLKVSYPEVHITTMPPLPFDEMEELETLSIYSRLTYDGPWWEGSVLRVVKLENVNWVDEVSTFLDFLQASDQLESFHYSVRENVLSQDELAPQILDDTYGTIVLPNMAHFLVYSIPAFHLLTILRHVSFPEGCRINATAVDSFPPEQPDGHEFIVPIMDRLLELRPPQLGLGIKFGKEEAWINTAEQRWDLGFCNDALNLEPREEAYRALLQQIPPNIRALIHSVNAINLPYAEDNPALLVKALSEDVNQLIMFESRLNDKWLSALWTDRSRGWDGFLLPRLRSIRFVVCESSTAANFRTLIDLLQARSAAVHGGMPALQTTLTVPENFEEGEIQAALQDPILLNLGLRIERIATSETKMLVASEEDMYPYGEEDMYSDGEEDMGSDGEGSVGTNDLGGDETLL